MSDILGTLPRHYQVILCDLWGCVHNGVTILPGVVERLDRWREEGRDIIFLTNAPRPSTTVAEQLSILGLPDHLNHRIVSSGDVALVAIAEKKWQSACAFLGSQADRQRLEATGLQFVSLEAADIIVCSGFDERGFDIVKYIDDLTRLSNKKAQMLCLNPDRVVHRGDQVEPCAGKIADVYLKMGGVVHFFGKPYASIYDYAMRYLQKEVDKNSVVAIGDSVATDFVGAANAKIDFIFVTEGIDKGSWRKNADLIFENIQGLNASSRLPIATVPAIGKSQKVSIS